VSAHRVDRPAKVGVSKRLRPSSRLWGRRSGVLSCAGDGGAVGWPARCEPALEGTDGYYQNWYPIGFAREVGVGQVVAKDFLDGRVVMYRGASGRVAVLSAYRRHLGAAADFIR